MKKLLYNVYVLFWYYGGGTYPQRHGEHGHNNDAVFSRFVVSWLSACAWICVRLST